MTSKCSLVKIAHKIFIKITSNIVRVFNSFVYRIVKQYNNGSTYKYIFTRKVHGSHMVFILCNYLHYAVYNTKLPVKISILSETFPLLNGDLKTTTSSNIRVAPPVLQCVLRNKYQLLRFR